MTFTQNGLADTDRPFGVDLPALIAVLSESLYSDKTVAIRELLANARDSLLRARSSQLPRCPELAITISTDFRERELCIRDNGLGMTREEAESRLSVLASSGTRLLRASLPESDPELGDLLAGQFGLGFFSALMIADRIEVLSRSASGGSGIRWLWQDGATTYRIEALGKGEWEGCGTAVRLTLKTGMRHLADASAIAELVQRYCTLMEFPIRLAGQPGPLNRMTTPWSNGEEPGEHEIVQFLRDLSLIGEDETPLFMALLRSGGGYGGVLFLPESPSDDGDVALYVRHVFVNRAGNYMGKHLGFMKGVLDCPGVPLTLSRESAIEGEALQYMRDSLEHAALAQLHICKQQKPSTYRRLMAAYGRQFKIAALQDEKILDLVADELHVTLCTGESMSLAQLGRLAEANGGQIAFVDDAETQSAYGSMLSAKGRPVVDASDRLDFMLLHKFGQSTKRDVERADISATESVRPAEGDHWRRLEQVVGLIDSTVSPSVVMLDAEVPALFQRGHMDALRDMASKAARDRGGKSSPLGMLFSLFSERRSGDERRVLLLNAEHDLVKGLATAADAGRGLDDLRVAVGALVASARSFSEQLTQAERWDAYQAQTRAVAALVQRAGEA